MRSCIGHHCVIGQLSLVNPTCLSNKAEPTYLNWQLENKVIVYKLITEDTVEEKIQDLQAKKKALLSEIIDIDSGTEKSLNFDEIKSLVMV